MQDAFIQCSSSTRRPRLLFRQSEAQEATAWPADGLSRGQQGAGARCRALEDVLGVVEAV